MRLNKNGIFKIENNLGYNGVYIYVSRFLIARV